MSALYCVPGLRSLLLFAQRMLLYLMSRSARNSRGLRVYGIPVLKESAESSIRIGDRCVMISHSYFSEVGVSQCVVRAMHPGAEVVIGNDVGMSGATICARERVKIGDGCLIGANAMIVDTDFHPIHSPHRRYDRTAIATAPVELEYNVFVGAGAKVLKGVTIGCDSVVAAGAVVTSDVPRGAIVAGVPARIVGYVDVTSNENS